MTPQQLLGIAVRLFAIWLGLTCIGYFSTLPATLRTMQGTDNAVVFVYTMGTIYGVGAVLLWFFPMMVAHRLLPRTHHDNLLSVQGHALARTGCALIGLWLVAQELPRLFRLSLYATFNAPGASLFSTFDFQGKIDFFVTGFNFILALLLIFKAGSFASLVFREPEEVPEPTPAHTEEPA